MQFVLHVGTQKTGSKALQHYLRWREDNVGDVLFPRAGRGPHGAQVWHRQLVTELTNFESSSLIRLKKEADASAADLCVVSYEGMHKMSKESIELVRDVLGDPKVVIFLREQADFINSFSNQMIKAHRTSWQHIYDWEAGRHGYNADLDYQAILERWAGVVGHDHLLPVVYKKEVSAASAFCSAAGIDDAGIPPQTGNPNPALDAYGLAVLKEVKRSTYELNELPAVVSSAHQLLREAHFVDTYFQPAPSLVGEREISNIRSLYLDSNNEVRRRYFPTQVDLFEYHEFGGYVNLDEVEVDRSLVSEIISLARSGS